MPKSTDYYYQRVRREIRPLLPAHVTQILDIGAGSGTTLSWLKTIYPDAETTGVELSRALLPDLEANADKAIIGNIDECLDRLSTYDLILLLDVLEHLPDSIGTLRKVTSLLKPGGQILVSIPNISHFSVTIPLLLQRRFTYKDAGIMDRTHLRFFVENTAIELMNEANLFITRGILSGLQGPRSKLFNLFTFGLIRHHLTKQYIMLGELRPHPVSQKSVRWSVAKGQTIE